MDRTKRGPYKRYRLDPTCPVPRQTRHNWRRAAKSLRIEGDRPVEAEIYTQNSDTESESAESESDREQDTFTCDDADTQEDANAFWSESDSEDEGVARTAGPGSTTTSPALYPGAQITEEVGVMLVMSLAARHNLTNTALADILKVVTLHLPLGCAPTAYSSVYKLLKHAASLGLHGSTKITHHLCGKCGQYMRESECGNSECGAISEHVQNDMFLELPIEAQIQTFFQMDEFRREIMKTSRARRLSGGEGAITDISDGQAYQKHLGTDGFLANSQNISLTMNTDGAPVYKSSSVSLWPVYFVVNELPPTLRFTKRYSILAGLWCSSKAPPMFDYLRPIMERCKNLEETGVIVTNGSQTATCRVMVLCSVVDLPAKAKLQNFTLYNGAFGCTVCEHEGTTVAVGRGHARVYEYKDPPPTLRTHIRCVALGKRALLSGEAQVGVKGLSPLHILPSFDVVEGVSIDYMHCVLEGVGKRLCNLWFEGSSGVPYHIGRHAELVDQRLRSIKPPYEITRTPRSIHFRKRWKASEFRSWILYYALPVLEGLLPATYHRHFALLVCSMHILLGDNISTEELSEADSMLKRFCAQFEEIYGIPNCTINVHLLTHLVRSVKLHGPLWSNSSFWFESLNGQILRLQHGTRHAALQVQAHWCLTKNAAVKISQVDPRADSATRLLRELNGFTSRANDSLLSDGCYSLGKTKETKLNPEEFDALNTFLQCNGRLAEYDGNEKVNVFLRACVRGNTIYSARYRKVKKRNNYTVELGGGRYGEVQFFATVCLSNGSALHLAFIKDFAVLPASPVSGDDNYVRLQFQLSKFFFPVEKPTHSLRVVELKNLVRKCILIEIEGKFFVTIPPNLCEKD